MKKELSIGKLGIDLSEQWSELINSDGFNWVQFYLVHIGTEKEYIHGTWEVEIYLLGFGIRLYGVWNDKMLEDKMEEYKKIIDDPSKWVEL